MIFQKLLHEHDADGLKLLLGSLPARKKGTIFESLLAELYRGNGWLVQHQGGRGDAGADILLYHPKTPSTVSLIIQAKNHALPLTFDQARIELIKFEEQSAPLHKCQNFRLVAVNGFVSEAQKLGEFNLLLDGWEHIDKLVSCYDSESYIEPSIELFAHNRTTYEQIKALWQETDHVAVVQATGTGKSFLIAKVLADFFDKRKIVLAPSNYILEQQQGKVPWLSDTTDYTTYAKLGWMSVEEIAALHYELIVLDEFHRCGADVWGAGVQALLNSHPGAKVLGTSATPVRYLDNARDMAKELFDGVIAVDLSLSEAIVRRILPSPTYISTLYTIDEEIGRLLSDVNASRRTEEEKAEYRKEIKKIRLDWEKTSGVPEILRKHLPSEINKLIVFCRDQQHLDEMEIEVQHWFLKAGTYSRRKTYRVLSADPESNHNLEAFKKAEGKDTVHLMFAIDMLNEGLHIPEVGAVILLRPTESPNIFYQQIGRCMEVGKDRVPVIFDLVNNFQNLRVNDFLADLEEAREAEVQRRAELGLTDYTPTIRINELARPIEEIFEAIRNRIGFWGYMFEQLCEYKDTHGDCVVPSTFKVSPSLAIWVSTQRWRYNKNRLSADQIQQLEQVGFIWNPRETNWDMMYQELCKFSSAHGHCKVPLDDPDNFTLGRWVCKQRSRKSTLSHERILRLEDIGFNWNPVDVARENMFIELCAYRERYGNCNVPDKFDQNPALGTWVGRLRSRYRKGYLTEDWIERLNAINFICNPVGSRRRIGQFAEDWIERLNAIGFDWDPNSTTWQKYYTVYRAYKEKTDHCLIQKKDPDFPSLASWVDAQRQARKKNRLRPEQIQLLDDINFVWDPYGLQWNEKYNELCEYKANNGDCNVPDDYPENRSLGSWVGNQRMAMKKGKLSDDQVKLLEKIGFIWDTRSAFWEKMFNALSEYKNKNGHANVPCQYSQFPMLGRWVNTQRTNWKKGLMPQEKIERLDGIGFIWSPTESSYEATFSALLEYKNKHGDCIVPKGYPENPSLAVWVGTRRALMRKGRLKADQIQRLDEMGFEWNPYDAAWEANYSELCSFKEANAHCNVPQSYSTLGRWVSKQRQRRRKGQLPEEKIKRLDDVGFTWEPNSTNQ